MPRKLIGAPKIRCRNLAQFMKKGITSSNIARCRAKVIPPLENTLRAAAQRRADRAAIGEVVQRDELSHHHAMAAAAVDMEGKGDAVEGARELR